MIVIFILISLISSSDTFETCNATSSLQPLTFLTIPSPIDIRQSTEFDFSVIANEKVEKSSCTMTLTQDSVPIFRTDFDLCKALQCPIEINTYNVSFKARLPSLMAEGKYITKISCKDDEKNTFCGFVDTYVGS